MDVHVADVPRETSETSRGVSDTRHGVDLSGWITKQQAAAAIGVTPKTIERLAQAGKLEQRSRPQARGPNVAVYDPGDVDRLVSERHVAPPPFVLPAGTVSPPAKRPLAAATAESTALTVTDAPALDEDPLRALVALVRTVMSQTSETSAGVSQTLYVTVKEAAGILGLPQADVLRLVHDGDLSHRMTGRGGIRIRRRDLEQL
jgi:excisionase family DNA binding protein